MLDTQTRSESVDDRLGNETVTSRLRCPRCELTLAPQAPWLTVEHCPRCIARARTLVCLIAGPDS
jgi:uncharacterized C2H2 Zn-finger protein